MRREEFINGTKKNMINSDKASELFDEIAKFAGYGFNKKSCCSLCNDCISNSISKTQTTPLNILMCINELVI